MTIYLIDEHHLTHTCPADPAPHPVITERTIVHTTPGRPCQTPATIHCGAVTVTIPCRRHEPHDRQCGPCRTIITTRQTTTTPLDAHHTSAATAPGEPRPEPYPVRPQATPPATTTGRHLPCPPRRPAPGNPA
jgi:hypothetical protein